jgi:predicted metal-dependent hydrolase
MQLKIRRQNRRNMMMRPVPGGLEVFIPHWLHPDHPQVKQFIDQGKQKLADHVIPVPQEQTTEAQIREMVAHWSPIIGVSPSRIQFRQMTRKWGSCSSKGTVTFNRALCWLPEVLAEYVVVHELVHLIELNHGAGFQALMTQHLPDWRQREADLHAGYSTFGTC